VIIKFEIGTISDITYNYQAMMSACVTVSGCMIPTGVNTKILTSACLSCSFT